MRVIVLDESQYRYLFEKIYGWRDGKKSIIMRNTRMAVCGARVVNSPKNQKALQNMLKNYRTSISESVK
jgi:DNA/RNA-binding domain of Phe-tRNA-synthetase-like protein